MADELTDHQRGCAGRDYICTCGYDDARDHRLEAFRQEVSDALKIYSPESRNPALGRFIINADKPDALVDVWGDLFIKGYNLDQFCDALEARGFEIREKK
jgi:hypothetical protein